MNKTFQKYCLHIQLLTSHFCYLNLSLLKNADKKNKSSQLFSINILSGINKLINLLNEI